MALNSRPPSGDEQRSLSNMELNQDGVIHFAVASKKLAAPCDFERARRGYELFNAQPLHRMKVPYYWIINRSIAFERVLDLCTGAVVEGGFSEACAKIAAAYAKKATLNFGTLWLLPDDKCGWRLGGINLFPASDHANGIEKDIATALLHRYRDIGLGGPKILD